jgi:CheY-like chemotaxis protein
MSGILFIDAEQPFADQTAGALRARGFDVKLMDDGKDGLDWAAKSRPDLIVLCVELPKMSGYSICNKLKKDNDLKGIPLIITSKEATPETFAQHKKLKTRAEDYLIKPFSDGDLFYKIGALIPVPGAGGGASAPAPKLDDSLESLGDLDLGGPSSSSDSEIRLDQGDLASLDLPGAPPAAAPSPKIDDDVLAGLDSGLDGLTGQRASLGDFDLKDDLGGLDDALDGLSAEPAAAAPAPAPAPRPAPAAPAPRPAVSMPPAPSGSNAADLAALQAARRETSDLKAKVGELEARLRQAEEAAKSAAASTSMAPTSASSAREVLALKQQLRAKDDEILQKEQSVVELQEQLERVQAETQQKLSEAGNKDIEISSLKARVQGLTDERDQLEEQVQGRLQQAEADAAKMRAALEQTQQQAQADLAEANARADEGARQLDEAKRAAEKQRADAQARLQKLEAELKEKDQDVMKAYQRLKNEEQLRAKAKEAAELAVKLLKGDVDMRGSSELEL